MRLQHREGEPKERLAILQVEEFEYKKFTKRDLCKSVEGNLKSFFFFFFKFWLSNYLLICVRKLFKVMEIIMERHGRFHRVGNSWCSH